MNAQDFALMLTGRQYRKEITQDECLVAQENRLLVAYGYSDDNLELRGLMHNEYAVGEDDSVVLHHTHPDCSPLEIKVRWQPESLKCSWEISANVTYSIFDIFEGEELFCRGIVIAEEDMIRELSPQPPATSGDTPSPVADSTLRCPHCEGTLLYQQKIEVFQQRLDTQFGMHVTLEPGSCRTDRDLSEIPRPSSGETHPTSANDQYQLRLWLLCATCATTKTLSIIQHGGSIRMEWGS